MKPLSRPEVATVAAAAKVDPRTVVRALAGSRQSEVVRAAIVEALRVNGHKAWALKLERGIA